jgi:hypothetical protein
MKFLAGPVEVRVVSEGLVDLDERQKRLQEMPASVR